MKKILLGVVFFIITSSCFAQQRLFSIGYGKTFVSNDSTTVSLTLDLNRIPGQSERAGGYYFVNEVLGEKGWGYYIKPTVDINIGSSVASSPNNIFLGVPIGLVYDFEKTPLGIFSLYIEGSPEMNADKTFKNNLHYFTINTYLKYEFLTESMLMNVFTGISNANGVRNQVDIETDSYGRLTVPVFLKLNFWNALSPKERKFRRVNWTSSLKFNYVYADNDIINEDDSYIYFNSRLDFYITPNIGINAMYFNGQEEPLFRENHAISFGITLAR
ncbi:hypothetical protein M0D21_01365 [Aquimarina sp. D1M17]|uniref:hypothetical protein n=1 Tax=Aquimarina acroporae TaxID=2937283 RepID=UPI0020BE6C87|nr:hypothetical protein [Aquimarina acroporae]MCK8520192.1 hypothetical protein [Aquimarina acroporae]